MKLSYLRKWMLIERIGKKVKNDEGEVLSYPLLIVSISNILFFLSLIFALLYCVKLRSYVPLITIGILSYVFSRIIIIFFIQPRFYKESKLSLLWIIVFITLVFIFINFYH